MALRPGCLVRVVRSCLWHFDCISFLLAAGSPHSLWRMVSAVLLLFVLTAIFPTFVFRICTYFVQDRDRRILPFVRSVSMLLFDCSDLDWIREPLGWSCVDSDWCIAYSRNRRKPCGMDLRVSNLSECDFLAFSGVYEVHRTARVFRRSSAAVRGRMLAQASPKLREYILNWMKNHGAS